MTPQEEAIKYHKGMLFPQSMSPSILKAIEMNNIAIKALQKQIPMPMNHTIRDSEESSPTCPACGSFAIWDYCMRCGQRLLWEDEDE